MDIIWIFLFFHILITLLCLSGSYVTSYLRWSIYSNKCLEAFKQEQEIKNILFIKEYTYKYLAWFLTFFVINGISFSFFTWLTFDLLTLDSNPTIAMFTPNIVWFILSLLLFFFVIRYFLKKLEKIGFSSKKDAIASFEKIKANNDDQPVTSFALLKNNKPSIQDFPLQFQQRRYQKKLKRLNHKNLPIEKYNSKLLHFFTLYVTTYATFLLRNITTSNASVTFEGSYEEKTFDDLASVLIANFFAFSKEVSKVE